MANNYAAGSGEFWERYYAASQARLNTWRSKFVRACLTCPKRVARGATYCAPCAEARADKLSDRAWLRKLDQAYGHDRSMHRRREDTGMPRRREA